MDDDAVAFFNRIDLIHLLWGHGVLGAPLVRPALAAEGQLAIKEDLLLRGVPAVNVHVRLFAFVVARLTLISRVLRTALIQIL